MSDAVPPQRLPSRRRLRRGWIVAILGAGLLLFIAIFVGRDVAVRRALQAAMQDLERGAIGPAAHSLDRAERFKSRDYRIDLARAAGFRHLGDRDAWTNALARSEQCGAPRREVQRERELGLVHFGDVEQVLPRDFDLLVAEGISPRDAITAVVQGLLAKGHPQPALDLLERGASSDAGAAQAAYLRGMCFWSTGQREAAEAEFSKAIDAQPDHELAHSSLGRLLEQQDLLAQAQPHYEKVLSAAPGREAARIDLARVLRKQSRIDEAEQVLPTPRSAQSATSILAVELAERAYESGAYDEARHWFEQADLEGPHIADTLRAAASSFALAGDSKAALRLFSRVDETQAVSRQVGELQRRLAIDPGDAIAARELEQLSQHGVTLPRSSTGTPVPVSPLYVEHCAACHGADGSGDGRAARYLFPRPRDLRGERYRLVSTLNQVPTRQDIERVILRGIPGTAMRGLIDLSNDERKELSEQVLLFYRAGVRDRLIAQMQQESGFVDDGELARKIGSSTTPGDTLDVPRLGRPDSESIERGREVYFATGCHQCHGDDGTGETSPPQWDDRGRTTLPRNLVYDPMKGGADPQSLYRRIRLGMPGTAHPAAASLEEESLRVLVHFCVSLMQSPQHDFTNHERGLRAARQLPAMAARDAGAGADSQALP